MKTRTAAVIVAMLALVYGAIDGHFYAKGLSSPRALDLPLALIIMVVAYLWYKNDSATQGFQGSSLLAGGIILISILAVPVYLLRSRPKGAKLKSLLSFFALLVACLVLSGLAFSSSSALSGA